mgnify:CR=1 FL=1
MHEEKLGVSSEMKENIKGTSMICSTQVRPILDMGHVGSIRGI